MFIETEKYIQEIEYVFCFAEKYLFFGSTYKLAFEFRPRNLTGLVFHKNDKRERTLTLFLKKGKVNENTF